jgi:MFS family permease
VRRDEVVNSVHLINLAEYWHFLLSFGLLAGLGSSLLFTPSIAAIGHFFSVRRGFATGIASTGGSAGGIVYPLMLQQLFAEVGWGWAIRILGFLALAMTAISNVLIRSRLPPLENASAHPNAKIFKNVAFAWTTAGVFLLEFALFIPLTYISLYALDQGFSDGFSFQILTILNAASIVGRALPGWIADVIGPFNCNICCIGLSIITCFGVWLPAGHTTAGLVVFAISFGFASGSNISLGPICIGKLCQTQEYGRYYATCYTVVSIACLVNIPIAGSILRANNGNYSGLITLTGAVYTGSLACFLMARMSRTGRKVWVVI